MKGSIRAKGRCPRCEKPFTDVSKGISMHKRLGIICISCKSIPRRFYVDLHHQGKRIRLFSDRHGNPLDSYQVAENLRADINHDILHGRFDPSVFCSEGEERFRLSPLVDAYLARRLVSAAPSCRSHYRRYGKIASGFFGLKDVREVRDYDIREFREHVQKHFSLSERTVKNILDFLRTFLRYCKNEEKVISVVPAFPEMNLPERRQVWLSRRSQEELCSHLDEGDRPIITFLMLHGCRPSGARALRCMDVDLQTETITLFAESRNGRGRRRYSIPLHSELHDFVGGRVRNDLPEAPVFLNPRTGGPYSASALDRVWSEVRRKTGLPKEVRLTDAARYSFVSKLIQGGLPSLTVSKLLGLSDAGHVKEYEIRSPDYSEDRP